MKDFTTFLKNRKLQSGLAILFWLLLWQLAATFLRQEILLVSPVSVIQKLFTLLPQKNFWQSLFFSFGRISFGFFLGLLFGSLTAILSAYSKGLRLILAPLIATVKSVPVASFVILALFFIPSKNLSVFISFLMVFPIFYSNLLQGVLETDVALIEMAKVFHATPYKKIRYIYVSQVLPYFKSACSLALGLCWKSGIAAEVIGIPTGSIGEKLYEAKIFLQTADLFAWTLVIALLSLGFEKLFLWFVNQGVYLLEGGKPGGHYCRKSI